MFDVNDDAKGDYRRVEILTGPGRRRRWSAAEKARIVEETLAPGARVSEVARRWQVCPQQVFSWRRAARQDMTTTPARAAESVTPAFVPIMSEAMSAAPVARAAASAAPVIEVKLAGAVVRVVSTMDDAAQLTAVLRAVRASASRA
jgi:transposase